MTARIEDERTEGRIRVRVRDRDTHNGENDGETDTVRSCVSVRVCVDLVCALLCCCMLYARYRRGNKLEVMRGQYWNARLQYI
jgi:hypothetical protein